ncbi:hypothetical protein JW905_17775, partial [bacterium]|nr:hypothetical protein [candidate division CSSED10-310 bacterium]
GVAEQVAKALFNKGVSLGALGRTEEELACLQTLTQRYGTRHEPGIAAWVSASLILCGSRLTDLEQPDRALQSFKQAFASSRSLMTDLVKAVFNTFVIYAAARGHAALLLEALRDSPAAQFLEPLVAALSMMTGQSYSAPREVTEVAYDVIKRINELRQQFRSPDETEKTTERS